MPSQYLPLSVVISVLLLTSVFSAFSPESSLSVRLFRPEAPDLNHGSFPKSGTGEYLEHVLQGADGINLEGEDLHDTMLAGKRLRMANLKGANLRLAMLAGADLRQTNLEHADFGGSMLLGANLSGANLAQANFEEAMLLGAQLDGAWIEGANFRNAVVNQYQIDQACGQPDALPVGVRMPKPC
jgi:uncharacterized protein YjbI with pentapeptide repeats